MGNGPALPQARSMVLIAPRIAGPDALQLTTRRYSGTAVALTRWTPAVLLAAVLAIVQMQVLAFPQRNPITDALSTYVHANGGWLFPVGLVLLAVGMIGAAGAVAATLSGTRAAVGLLRAGGAGGLAAAVFPADVANLTVTWRGEVHRYSSMVLLVMPLLAALTLVRRIGSEDSQVARRLRRLSVAAILAGLLFLLGFLPQLLPHSSFADLSALSAVSGLSQRLLVLFLVVTLAVLVRFAGARLREQHTPAGPELAVAV